MFIYKYLDGVKWSCFLNGKILEKKFGIFWVKNFEDEFMGSITGINIPYQGGRVT
jgi:hypothetical protein